jgi:hypothetical protein
MTTSTSSPVARFVRCTPNAARGPTSPTSSLCPGPCPNHSCPNHPWLCRGHLCTQVLSRHLRPNSCPCHTSCAAQANADCCCCCICYQWHSRKSPALLTGHSCNTCCPCNNSRERSRTSVDVVATVLAAPARRQLMGIAFTNQR